MKDVTKILSALSLGEKLAANRLLPVVYDELRKLASARMAQESPGHTLSATALVHEAYLRMVEPSEQAQWENRAHFFAAAAQAMRRILVESARRKQFMKHGSGVAKLSLDEDLIGAAPDRRKDLVALDEALSRLEKKNPQAAKLVELRHFAGLSIADAAKALDISPRSANRIWAYARAWLLSELTDSDTARQTV